MPVKCHFHGCKALLYTVKRRYIKYHAFAFFASHSLVYQSNYSIKNTITLFLFKLLAANVLQ